MGRGCPGNVFRFRPITRQRLDGSRIYSNCSDVFWGPMAFAIMGGLFVATMLTLIRVPCLMSLRLVSRQGA